VAICRYGAAISAGYLPRLFPGDQAENHIKDVML
jgi:hypothetical protein